MAISDQIRSITYFGWVTLITGSYTSRPGESKFPVIARTKSGSQVSRKYFMSFRLPNFIFRFRSGTHNLGVRYCLLGKQEETIGEHEREETSRENNGIGLELD
jgi:hypothetical protein